MRPGRGDGRWRQSCESGGEHGTGELSANTLSGCMVQIRHLHHIEVKGHTHSYTWNQVQNLGWNPGLLMPTQILLSTVDWSYEAGSVCWESVWTTGAGSHTCALHCRTVGRSPISQPSRWGAPQEWCGPRTACCWW